MTGQCGTFQWMSPEVMQSQRYTEKADVFSFGIILWEVLFRQVPYQGMNSVQVSIAVITQNLRPPIPADTPAELARLMQECWATVCSVLCRALAPSAFNVFTLSLPLVSWSPLTFTCCPLFVFSRPYRTPRSAQSSRRSSSGSNSSRRNIADKCGDRSLGSVASASVSPRCRHSESPSWHFSSISVLTVLVSSVTSLRTVGVVLHPFVAIIGV
jgi:serine/threonine protein kinase